MITRAHIAAWTLAALSGGVLACESETEEKPARAHTAVHTTRGGRIEHFRHNGNDCYVYAAYGIACVRAEGGR